MRTLVLLLLAVGSSTIAAAAPSSDIARLAAAQKALERGVYAKTPETLVQARAEFEAMSNAKPKSAALHYWIAVADWRLIPRLEDKKQGAGYCKDGLAHIDRALALDAKMAEALAVKASLQGLSMRFESVDVMTLGQEIESNMARAATLDPKNPRIRLLQGVNTLHKPAFVGGGADKALPIFEQAIALYATESHADSLAPAWGREDALIWAGRSSLQLGNHTEALAYYKRALEVNPANGWVRGSLVPEAEKAAQVAAAKADSSGQAPATSAAGSDKP